MTEAPSAAPFVVLCFGDSNTHGSCPMHHEDDRRRFPRGVRWPGRMAAELGPGYQVIEEGHPGRTTVRDDPEEGAHKNGIRTLLAILESHRPIDLVVLMLGTNDLKAQFGVGAARIADGVDRLLGVIADSAAGPGQGAPDVLLVAPPPITEAGWLAEMFAGGAEVSRALGPALRALAEARGVGFFDAGGVIATDPLDGVHFGAEAHLALGAAMAGAVRARAG